MAAITPALIKDLRERTQAGMNDCKAALVEADGNIDAAVEIILKKGIVKAASRAGRVATEGEIRTFVTADAATALIVEVNCQTDFVARGEEFRNFVSNVMDVAKGAAEGVDLNTLDYPGAGKSVDAVRNEMIAKTGENTVVRRWARVTATSADALVHAYVHPGSKLAVLIEASAPAGKKGAPEFLKFIDECSMQVAAMSPIVVSKNDLSQANVDSQRAIFAGQLKEEGKPEASWPKIIEGKVAKWYTEVTLLGQEAVIEPGATIDKQREALGKVLGGEVTIHRFVRFSLGEGIEKKTDDLAEEVAKLM
jgi:elongation factor Ts